MPISHMLIPPSGYAEWIPKTVLMDTQLWEMWNRWEAVTLEMTVFTA